MMRRADPVKASKQLPFDIITEILSWLPIDSLVRFKLVCKNWYFFIVHDRKFIAKHKERTCLLRLRYVYKHEANKLTVILDKSFGMEAFCAGLVLEKSLTNSQVFRIRNPATHQVLYLPNAHEGTRNMDFALNPSTHECKVDRFIRYDLKREIIEKVNIRQGSNFWFVKPSLIALKRMKTGKMVEGRVDPIEVPKLPFDIISEILSWLPVESLLRFRCVCKQWCLLLTQDHLFIAIHSHRASRLTLRRMSSPGHILYDKDFKFLYHLSGGLLLEMSLKNSRVYRIRNPVIHQVLYLPDAHEGTDQIDIAFNSFTHECKVVCVHGEDGEEVGFEVLTDRPEWKDEIVNAIGIPKSGVLQLAINYVYPDGITKTIILVEYDMSSQTVIHKRKPPLPFPYPLPESCWHNPSLIALKGMKSEKAGFSPGDGFLILL
ncbi:hypothetical protein GBA52_014411 [Prunus armeniaca]|nr:hypothetical protein GBA52_014411 [Prunus armeniaca]